MGRILERLRFRLCRFSRPARNRLDRNKLNFWETSGTITDSRPGRPKAGARLAESGFTLPLIAPARFAQLLGLTLPRDGDAGNS
jgi:hypothetical protein